MEANYMENSGAGQFQSCLEPVRGYHISLPEGTRVWQQKEKENRGSCLCLKIPGEQIRCEMSSRGGEPGGQFLWAPHSIQNSLFCATHTHLLPVVSLAHLEIPLLRYLYEENTFSKDTTKTR